MVLVRSICVLRPEYDEKLLFHLVLNYWEAIVSDQTKWYLKDDVFVKVTFRYAAMSKEDYEVWVPEEAKWLRLSEIREFANGLSKYGYDLFSVAWLNLVIKKPDESPIFTKSQVIRSGENTLRVVRRESKVTRRLASPEDLARLERTKKPALEPWELAERDEMGVAWLRCHAADEAYEVDFTTREEMEAWRAHDYMNRLVSEDEDEMVA